MIHLIINSSMSSASTVPKLISKTSSANWADVAQVVIACAAVYGIFQSIVFSFFQRKQRHQEAFYKYVEYVTGGPQLFHNANPNLELQIIAAKAFKQLPKRTYRKKVLDVLEVLNEFWGANGEGPDTRLQSAVNETITYFRD